MFQSAIYAVFTDQFYTKLLYRSSWSWSFYLQISAQSLWEQKSYARFKIVSKPNISYCSAPW